MRKFGTKYHKVGCKNTKLKVFGLSIEISIRNRFENLQCITGNNHPGKIFKSINSQLVCHSTLIVHIPFTGESPNSDKFKKCIFATTEWTCYLAISIRGWSAEQTVRHSLKLLQFFVRLKGQSNITSAPKNNFLLPVTCRDLALT